MEVMKSRRQVQKQRSSIDYNETFSPVARFDIIRCLLSVTANEKLQLAQFDVKTAFYMNFLMKQFSQNSQCISKMLLKRYEN